MAGKVIQGDSRAKKLAHPSVRQLWIAPSTPTCSPVTGCSKPSYFYCSSEGQMWGRVSSASAKTWYLWQNSILLWTHIFFPCLSIVHTIPRRMTQSLVLYLQASWSVIHISSQMKYMDWLLKAALLYKSRNFFSLKKASLCNVCKNICISFLSRDDVSLLLFLG